MARQPKNFRIGAVSNVDPLKPVTYLQSGPDTAVPMRFRATIQVMEPELGVTIEVFVGPDLQPCIYQLSILTNTQRPVTTSRLRQVLVDQLLRAAMREAEVQVDTLPEGTLVGPAPVLATGKAEENASIAARIYRLAVTSGNPAPAQEVASAMGKSRAQVARYLRKAREVGYLTERWFGLDDEGNET